MHFYSVPRLPLLTFLLLFSFCLSAQTHALLSTQQTQSGSTVRGRALYNDGQPVKGVRVRVFTRGEDPRSGRSAVSTNELGEFQIHGLTAGKYFLSLEGNGVAQPSGMGMRIPLPLTAIPGTEDYPEIIPKHDAEFTVDGQNTVEIEVRTIRGGSIAGKVMKSNGAPVSSAAVNLISRDGSGPYMSRFSTQTDKDGNFRIENLPPGEYVVSAVSMSRQGSLDVLARLQGDSQLATYHPAAIRLSDALPVKVDSGRESSGVNVTLVPRKALSVSGTVVRGSDGSPLAGVVVVLRNREADITGPLAPGMMQRTVETGASGQWSFRNVEEGEYQIVALNPIGGTSQGTMSPRSIQRGVPGPPRMTRMDPGPRPRFLITQQALNLVGDKEGIVLTINGPGSINGIVENEDGEPLPAGLVLFFEFSNDGMRPDRPVPVRVNPDGSFVLTDVQGGDTYVNAALPSGAQLFIASAQVQGRELSSSRLTIVEGAEVGPLRIKLSTKFAIVSGTVDLAGQTSDVVVFFIPIDPTKHRFRTASTPLRVTAEGAFSAKLAPGEYWILARQARELPQILTPEFINGLSGSLPKVQLEPGVNKSIKLMVPHKQR